MGYNSKKKVKAVKQDKRIKTAAETKNSTKQFKAVWDKAKQTILKEPWDESRTV